MGPLPDISLAGWHETIETNLTSAFLSAKHQIPAMLARGAGALIVTSTFVGHTAGIPGIAAYAVAKAGIIGLTQALAAEFGPQGIRVNALLPGGTDTPAARTMMTTLEIRTFYEGMHLEDGRTIRYLRFRLPEAPLDWRAIKLPSDAETVEGGD